MDNYATHLPILRRIDSQYPIKQVIEFGAGQYSTPAFLDRHYFPMLHNLISLETDKGWYESIGKLIKDDRLFLNLVTTPLHEIAKNLVYTGHDLIFVDNGSTVSERVLLLEVFNDIQPTSLVVVHDYNVREYQHSVRDFPLKLIYSGLVPHTAVLFSRNCPYLNDWVGL